MSEQNQKVDVQQQALGIALNSSQQAGGVVQAAVAINRNVPTKHPRAREFFDRCAAFYEYILGQEGCDFQVSHGSSVMYAHGILNDPELAADFVKNGIHLHRLAQVVVALKESGRSVKMPDWLVPDTDGIWTVDHSKLAASEQSMTPPGAAAPPTTPRAAQGAGFAAYSNGDLRTTNPFPKGELRDAWFKGWDLALSAEETSELTKEGEDPPNGKGKDEEAPRV